MDFGKRKSSRRVLWPGLLLIGFIWLPFSWFSAYVSMHTGKLETAALSAVLCAVLGGAILRHLHDLYEYPLAEISGKYLIITLPIRKRAFYEIARVRHVRMIGPSVFFTHRGWPAIATLRGLDAEQLATLEQVLTQE